LQTLNFKSFKLFSRIFRKKIKKLPFLLMRHARWRHIYTEGFMKNLKFHCIMLIFSVLFSALLPVSCEFSEPPEEIKNVAKTGAISIMTWNLQALFDGTESGNEYEEYLESAGWSGEKYSGRLSAIAKAIDSIEPEAPDLIAIQEIESAQVLEDLAGGPLSKKGYQWTHFAGNPGMSLGIGLISRLPIERARVHSINIDGSAAPRPVLELRVSRRQEATENEDLILFICHWKSKLGGEDVTESARRASARIILRRMRELALEEPDLPVIIMGDLNENYDEFYRRNGAEICALLPDDPRSADMSGFNTIDEDDPAFGTPQGDPQKDFLVLVKSKPPAAQYFPPQALCLYSPWTNELENGSYYYKNEWETIDHFLLSHRLFDKSGWEFETCHVVDQKPFTNSQGYPDAYNPRTGSGLSDHLPLLMFLKYAD
jgi:endonuclease/exonuclease/phosphatase family metal-dependent hydrolase